MCLAPVSSCRSDAGAAIRAVERQEIVMLPHGGERRELAGTERLTGARGALTLRWNTVQIFTRACPLVCGKPRIERNGRWGRVRGRWIVTDATGAYSGYVGHGELSADRRFLVTAYRGLLITAH
jgi:hypothetical protein